MAFVLPQNAGGLMNGLSPRDEVTPQEALSGVFGSISLATWIFVLLPQLWLNYTQGKAEGIAIGFLIIWFIGDATNLAGAIWADLVPTVIALAFYFCLSDFILIAQCLYYNTINSRKDRNASITTTDTAGTEDEPLLTSRRSSEIGLPGSHNRRRSSARSEDVLGKILEGSEEEGGQWVRDTVSILGVIAVGTAGWAIAWQSGVWVPTPEDGGLDSEAKTAVGAKILGYASALCYLGARIPQIYKNYKDKSCEGLALLFFMLSLMGNLTYGASILAHSVEKEYLSTNLPWLIGSLGTIVEDLIIFAQFRMYREPDKKDSSAIHSEV